MSEERCERGGRARSAGAWIGAMLALLIAGPAARADEIARFNNDWSGNAITVDAIPDPGVDGVTCHLSQFTRGLLDRVTKGNFFEDPSNASIACRQTGPITVHKIERGPKGEEVFSERKSLIFKSIGVRRIFDATNNTLVYVVYSRQVTGASAKMAISSVALWGQEVKWADAGK